MRGASRAFGGWVCGQPASAHTERIRLAGVKPAITRAHQRAVISPRDVPAHGGEAVRQLRNQGQAFTMVQITFSHDNSFNQFKPILTGQKLTKTRANKGTATQCLVLSPRFSDIGTGPSSVLKLAWH